MTAATLNKVNEALVEHGVELVKGDGYFYFADLDASPHFRADSIPSVFSNVLRCMTLEEWVHYAEDHMTKP